MTYLRRSNPKGKKELVRKVGLVVLIVFLFSIHLVFPHFYGSIFYPITSVFWRSGAFIGDTVSHYIGLASSKKSLIVENERLQKEMLSFTPSLLMLDSLRRENETLRALLGRSNSGRMILATVLSRPPFSPYDSLIIDVGIDQGLAVGDKVYASTDVLLGDIVEVYRNTAKVDLFSSPGRVFPVLVGPSALQVEAEGRGGGNFRVILPTEVGVEKGDPVRFAQSKSNVVGVIEDIEVDSSDSLQEIRFKMPLSISEISYVEVNILKATSTQKR
jgi:rod shape-determining protein MreC